MEIPEHYRANLGGAMVHRAAAVIMSTNSVPAWLHQFANLWDEGLKYGYDGTFWQAVIEERPATARWIGQAGL